MPCSGDLALIAAIPISLLVQVVLAEAAVVAVGLALFLGHGLVAGPAGRRTEALRARGLRALETVLDEPGAEDGPVGPATRPALPALPRRIWIDVLTAVAPRLTGAQRERITALAGELGLLTVAGAKCRSPGWWRRLQGARLFTLLGGGKDAVPALLSDRRAEVRAQAAQWVVEHHDADTVDRLLVLLDADEDSTRFAVKDSLIRIGRVLTVRLASHLTSTHGPAAGPALEVAIALPDPVFLPIALDRCRDESGHVRALASTLAAAIGGAAALEAVVALLADDEPEVRAASARGVGRAGHWPAAAALYGLLGDESWDVRLQSSVALRRLGSPGILFLQRALSAEDPFVADAARRTLDLPDSVVGTV